MYLTPQQYIPGTIKALNPVKRKAGNPGGTQNRKLHYKDIIAAFDIETTRLTEIEQSIMYVWQLQLDGVGTIIGRTWNELLMLLKQFRDELQKETLCIFVAVARFLYIWHSSMNSLSKPSFSKSMKSSLT